MVLKVVKYILLDVLKSKFINGYLLFLLLLSFGLFSFTDDTSKGILGVGNIILLVVPLISLIFTGISIYNSTDFIRLLLTQPIGRSTIFFSQFTGITLALLYAFIIGAGIPVMIYCNGEMMLMMMLTGMLLTVIFSSLAFFISLKITDKVKGIGALMLVWLYFVVIYDGLMLLAIKAMSDYPVENYSMILALLNPVDMCRILMMFSMDISALMGLTGAVLQQYLGTLTGKVVIYFSLLLWMAVPLLFSLVKFKTKDF